MSCANPVVDFSIMRNGVDKHASIDKKGKQLEQPIWKKYKLPNKIKRNGIQELKPMMLNVSTISVLCKRDLFQC
jgi:hypothetical protein